MACCISRQELCIGAGNHKRFLFSVFDSDGDEMDISGATEIVMRVSDGEWIGGSLYASNTQRFEKRLTDGEVTIAGTGYQFIIDITPADTDLLVMRLNYYDVTVHTSSGMIYTIKAGPFKVTPTNAGI